MAKVNSLASSLKLIASPRADFSSQRAAKASLTSAINALKPSITRR
jgi:hypothetical protein